MEFQHCFFEDVIDVGEMKSLLWSFACIFRDALNERNCKLHDFEEKSVFFLDDCRMNEDNNEKKHFLREKKCLWEGRSNKIDRPHIAKFLFDEIEMSFFG